MAYLDTFTAPDSTLLSAHTSDSGATYPSADSSLVIVGNNLTRPTGSGSILAPISDPLDLPSGCQFTTNLLLNSKTGANVGPAGCLQNSNTTYYHVRFTTALNTVELYKFVAGSPTVIGSYDIGAWATPLNMKLTLEVTDAEVNVLLDDVQVITTTDTSITRNSNLGIRYNNAGGTEIVSSDAAITLPVIVTASNIEAGTASTWTVANFAGPITSAKIISGTAEISATSANNTGGVWPSPSNGANAVPFGSATLEVSDGVDTATISVTWGTKIGSKFAELEAGFDTSETSWLFNYGGTPATGDQCYYDNGDLTLNNDGTILGNDGTYPAYYIDVSDVQPVYEQFDVILGVSGGGGSSKTIRAERIKSNKIIAIAIKAV